MGQQQTDFMAMAACMHLVSVVYCNMCVNEMNNNE